MRNKPKASMRVSEFYKLGRTQPYLDFVDVPIGSDVPVFLDSSRLRSMNSTWATECVSLLQAYFKVLLRHLQAGDAAAGTRVLAALVERNEFHLGLSTNESHGTGFGPGFAAAVWKALLKSKASKSGLLQDLEDTCLFIEGIGPDRLSDAVCNIIRGPLIRYTQEMCEYYGIPLMPNVPSGPIWNPQKEVWEEAFIRLPVTPFGKLLLVPKLAVRHRIVWDPSKYYTHYLLPEMELAEKAANTALVHTLKDGRLRVNKKDLRQKYGADKLAIVEQTIKHPKALEEYRKFAAGSKPLTHEQLADIEGTPKPDLSTLVAAVVAVKPGRDQAEEYEDVIEQLLSALLFPSLSSPTKQQKIHEGRKRIDITYVNNAQGGFFGWLAQHYSCAHVFVECKNYGKDVGNPEVDQLSSRFSPSRGQVGILVCRSAQDENLLQKRLVDTAHDSRGFIVALTDDDLSTLVKDYVDSHGGQEFPLLRRKFNKLIL